MHAQQPIGMFDSGVGGLTVFKAVSGLMPRENLVYLGDTARLPYGTKSAKTIERYTLSAARRLVEFGIKMLVVACNTATAAALPQVAQAMKPMPVVGVIEPGASAAVAACRGGSIAVIATEATINGGAYRSAIQRRVPHAKLMELACPLLVPLAEEGWLNGPEAEAVLRRYLDRIFAVPEAAPDTLLLGCTHFPLFTPLLKAIVGDKVVVVDSASATAQQVREVLEGLQLVNGQEGRGEVRFLTTDNPARFARTGRFFLGRPMTEQDVELVDL